MPRSTFYGWGGEGRVDRRPSAFLVRQAEVYAEEAGQLLERVGVAAAASVIDVGCGALGILDLLCAKVGPGGRAAGVDREPRLLDAARQVAAQRGCPSN